MTIKVHMNDGRIEEFPNAYAYWEWDESEKGTDSAYRICSMDKNFTSAVAYVYPGECERIEITSEESDRIFKRSPPSGGVDVKWYKIFKAIDEERKRQEKRQGEQDLPLHPPGAYASFRQETHSIAMMLSKDFKRRPTWFTLLLKKILDAFLAKKLETQKKRLICVIAVVMQIIERLDRKLEAKHE